MEPPDYHIRDRLATLSSTNSGGGEQLTVNTVSPKTFPHVTSVYTRTP